MAQLILEGQNCKVFLGTDGAETEYSAEVTEVNITGGDRQVEPHRLLGSATIYFQKKRQDLYEVAVTFVKKDVDPVRYVLGGSGDNISGEGQRDTNDTFGLLFAENGDFASAGNRLQIKCQNVIGVTSREGTTADGWMEEVVTFKCKPSDYSERYAASASWSTLQ